ncbi:MAG TPA: 30S ribosomal protein S11 [Firmicutes bacterium]|nr:30S ribosomal protein S11 [Bacillota bacterium]
MAKKKKKKRIDEYVNAYIQSTFNNTIITITDKNGNVVTWGSAGTAGFKGTKKGTPFAAQLTAESVAKKAVNMGAKYVDVFIKGPGPGRETAVRALQTGGLVVKSIKDVTPIPHNGCRPPKRRRV